MTARLTLYTRAGCILCGQVKRQLEASAVDFDTVDASDPSVAPRLARLGITTFPALFVGGRYVGGYTHVVHLLTEGRLEALARMV